MGEIALRDNVSVLPLSSDSLDVSELTVDELAGVANTEHRLSQDAVGAAVFHAIRAGEVLNVLRRKLPDREWGQWLDTNFDGGRSTASLYMRVARNKQLVLEKGFLTVHSADRYLAISGVSVPQREITKAIMEAKRQEAREMRKQGMSYKDIAAHFDVNPTTIGNWLCSSQELIRKKQRDRAVAKKRRRALEIQQRDRAMRKYGGEVSRAYSQVRLLAQTLEDAGKEEPNKEARLRLSHALTKLYAVEDQIVRAVKVATNDKDLIVTLSGVPHYEKRV